MEYGAKVAHTRAESCGQAFQAVQMLFLWLRLQSHDHGFTHSTQQPYEAHSNGWAPNHVSNANGYASPSLHGQPPGVYVDTSYMQPGQSHWTSPVQDSMHGQLIAHPSSVYQTCMRNTPGYPPHHPGSWHPYPAGEMHWMHPPPARPANGFHDHGQGGWSFQPTATPPWPR